MTIRLGAAALLLAGTAAQGATAIGPDAAYCRPGADVPAALVEIAGLKDRTGSIRVELYPANSQDWLADRHKLVADGKTFRRVEAKELPATGPVNICVKLPAPGKYALAIIHQRGGARTFNFNQDGIAFPNNPRLGWSKPAVSKVTVSFGDAVTPVPVTMNYKQGLAMRPLKS